MKIKFLLIRTKILVVLTKFFGFLLAVNFPPIPSVGAIIINGKKVLVVKLTYRNGYALPGGVVESGETLEEAIKREVKEETGLEAVEVKYFGSFIAGIEIPGINATYIVKVKGNLKSSEEGVPSWEYPEEIISKIVYKDCTKALKSFFNLK